MSGVNQTKEFWDKTRYQVIEFILKAWTALDLQVQHNPHDKEKRKWLPEPISDAIQDDPDIDEMNDWLCQLLDVNFSLICEDDSCYEVARLLIEMERIVKKRDQTRMEEFVARLPKSSGAVASMSDWGEAQESSAYEEEVTEEQKTNVKPKKPVDDDMDVEDGWSVAR
jgi:hypothetical protein